MTGISDSGREKPTYLPVPALVGDKGTTFLTGGATLDHLKDGERLTLCEVGVPLEAEMAAAVREIQMQHIDLYRLVMHHGTEWQCGEPCEAGTCVSCDLSALEDAWREHRYDRPEIEPQEASDVR